MKIAINLLLRALSQHPGAAFSLDFIMVRPKLDKHATDA
jgi:hypothetical protein